MGNCDNSIKVNIALFNSKTNLKLRIDELKNQMYSSKSLVIKHCINSIRLDPKNIFLNKELLYTLNSIANDSLLSNEIKSEMLEEIFQDYGYYIPLTFYLGGMIILKTEELKRDRKRGNNIGADFNSNINEEIKIDDKFSYSEKEIDKMSISSFVNTIIGGNINEKTVEKWRVSINTTNSDIIGIDNPMEIT